MTEFKQYKYGTVGQPLEVRCPDDTCWRINMHAASRLSPTAHTHAHAYALAQPHELVPTRAQHR